MWLKFVVAAVVAVAVNGQVDLARHFAACRLRSTAFDDCLKTRLNELTPYFRSGLPDYGIGSFDPFRAERVEQHRNGPFFDYKLILRNVTESGWTQALVTQVKTNLPKNRAELTQSFPDKRLNGLYEVEGTFFGRKVRNAGAWNLLLRDYAQTLTVTRATAGEVRVKCSIVSCKKLELHIGNLAGGRTVIENTLDWIINNAWQPGFVVLSPLINDLVGTAFSDIFTEYFRDFPFDRVFH